MGSGISRVVSSALKPRSEGERRAETDASTDRLLSLLRPFSSSSFSSVFFNLGYLRNYNAEAIWVVKTFEALNEAYPHPENSLRNAAVGAVGSDYFGACWENRIKKDEVDIVFVEHG
jgi:hypothetical protein